MFSDKNFSMSFAPLNKRGKARNEKCVNLLLHYYLHQEKEGEEMEIKEELNDLREESPDLPRKASNSGSCRRCRKRRERRKGISLPQEVMRVLRLLRKKYSVNSDICWYLMAEHEDPPMTNKATHRLAVVNMDWDRMKLCKHIVY